MTRTLADVESDIRRWIAQSGSAFQRQFVDPTGETWVLKFFPPQYLASFMQNRKLVISVTPGFTWGDGVYIVPIDHVYSAMIYGRVGVMGWIDQSDLRRVYDAADPVGLALYREWIQFKPGLFSLLTTTVHAQFANRRLRNAFKKRFTLDLVVFRPDEFNRAYVQPTSDRWFVLSDFSPAVSVPGATAGFSAKIRDCELVAIGAEEFAIDRGGFVRQDLIGPFVFAGSGARTAASRPSLRANLTQMYAANRSRGAKPPQFLLAKP